MNNIWVHNVFFNPLHIDCEHTSIKHIYIAIFFFANVGNILLAIHFSCHAFSDISRPVPRRKRSQSSTTKQQVFSQ